MLVADVLGPRGLFDQQVEVVLQTACGKVGCYDVCIKNGTSTSTCAATCGTGTTVCDECGTKETPRDACFRVCAANGTSTSTCSATCG